MPCLCVVWNRAGMQEEATPLVSVITPAFNAAGFIQEAIGSVRSQTYPNWEMVVADDCSEDETRSLVGAASEADGRVRLLELSENGGPAAARNAALDAARGRYVAFLDSDDLWLPTKLEDQVSFMREKDAAFSFTGYSKAGLGGEKLGSPVAVPRLVDYDTLLKNTIIGCLTVMLDRSKTGPVSMGSGEIQRGQEDYVLWFGLLRNGGVAHGLQKELARYRIVEHSVSRDKLKAARRMWKLYREVERLSLPYSAWCFVNYAGRAYLKGRR